MGELEQLQNLAAKMRMATQTILPGRLRPELAELSTLLAAGGIGQTKSVTCRVAAPLEQAWQQHGAKTNGLLAHFGEGLIDFVSGSLPPGNMLSEVNSFGDRLSYVGSGSSPALQTARFKFGETNVELFAQRLPPGCVSRAEVVFTGSAGTVYLDWFGAWAATPNDGGRSVVGNSPNGCFERRLARLAWADLAEAIAHGREPKASFATVAPAARACLAANAAFQSGRTLRGDAGQISACASEIFRVMA
ncbi:MAG: hypothetical protein SFY81_08390 [Verrucomicrobiota bacterium]|nr:hypothetical protein [Verrucomicrobiota bacterium]